MDAASNTETRGWGRLVVAILASLYFLQYILTSSSWHFIDSVNLIIHEAGHVLFFFFGEFLHVLGGSFTQIAIPVLFVWHFYQRQDYFSASLLLFWVGASTIHVSIYAYDAVAMRLPLLGGDAALHDWNYLLGTFNLLPYTHQIGTLIFVTGVGFIIAASYLSMSTALQKNGRVPI